MGATCAHCQQQSGGRLGQLGRVPSPGRHGAHHVRADDGGFVDLHRHPGNSARHVRVFRRDRASQVRRHARGDDHVDRRFGRHGWSPAASRDDERRCCTLHRRRRVASEPPRGDALSGRSGRQLGRRHRALPQGEGGKAGTVGWVGGQRRRRVPEVVADGIRSRHRHRPDERTRSVVIPAERLERGCGQRTACQKPPGVHSSIARCNGGTLCGDGRLHGRWRRGIRLRQLVAP